MPAINPNEAAAAVRKLIEPTSDRVKVDADNTVDIKQIQAIFSSCPELIQDTKLMDAIYHFAVDRGGKTAEVGRAWITKSLMRQEGDITIFAPSNFLDSKDRGRMTRALRTTPNRFDVERGVLVLSKEKELSADKLWSFIDAHDVESLVIEGKEISGKLLKRYADVKPSVKEMVETVELKWDNGKAIELPKATLLCCGDYFQAMFRSGFRERDSSEISMASSCVSREIFGAILDKVETGKLPDVDSEEYKVACDYLQFEQLTGSIPEGAFGPAEWAKYFGDVGEVPALPSDLEVGDNQLLVLIPSTVDGKPYCLDLLGELIKNPKEGPATRYDLYDVSARYDLYGGSIRSILGQKQPEGSYWVLMDMDVIDGSKGKRRAEQLAMAREKEGCRAPKLLEAATAVLMHYVATGERKLSTNPSTFTCCQELVYDYKIIVGGFSSSGLLIYLYDIYDHDTRLGVVSLQEV